MSYSPRWSWSWYDLWFVAGWSTRLCIQALWVELTAYCGRLAVMPVI